MARNPFQPIIDAMQSARFAPESARDVIAWYDNLKQVNEAYANMLRTQGGSLNDNFKQDAGAAQQAAEFASQASRMSSAAEEARATFYRAHRDKIANLDDSHPHADKWDISKNRQ